MSLGAWGWDSEWASVVERSWGMPPGAAAARVVRQDRGAWLLQDEGGLGEARAPAPASEGGEPVVGDWVLAERGEADAPWAIRRVLPRRTRVSRGRAGTGAVEQVLAANVDRIWIVHGLDTPVNTRRLERYLAVAWESGGTPEVILTKADLAEHLPSAVDAARLAAPGVPVRVVSASDPAAVRDLGASLDPGTTIALLGPSGAGKSTLVNLLAGDARSPVGEVRPGDRKGRHTTTRRELHPITGGALLLDTPGLRELRVWDLGDGLERAFPEIDELAGACRFRDCAHETEPGCAVRAALEDGRLLAARFESFRKLRAEAAHQARKADPRARAQLAAEHRSIMKSLRLHPRYRDRE